jgi:hypothetical protein
MKTTRILTIVAGWLATTYALVYAMMKLELHWNFFDWSPEWDGRALLYGMSILAILVCVWFLANATRDRVSRVVSVLVCLLLLGFAIVYVLPAEHLTAGFMLRRTMPSPLWYRGGCSMLLCLPGVFWLLKVWHNSDHDSVA